MSLTSYIHLRAGCSLPLISETVSFVTVLFKTLAFYLPEVFQFPAGFLSDYFVWRDNYHAREKIILPGGQLSCPVEIYHARGWGDFIMSGVGGGGGMTLSHWPAALSYDAQCVFVKHLLTLCSTNAYL